MNHTQFISQNSTFSLEIPLLQESGRVDKYLAEQFPLYSRTFLQKIIEQARVTLNGAVVTKGGTILKAGDTLIITFPEHTIQPFDQKDIQALNIDLVFEHPHFLIINKPAGVLVHKPNQYSTVLTVVDWALNHYQEIASVGTIDRPGIVHRIDKDTSGLLIIPRTQYAHAIFGQKFKDRSINKTYYAVVHGAPERVGTIDYAIGRHPHTRIKMHTFDKQLIAQDSHTTLRSALTYYKVLDYYTDTALIEVKPVTGRTHQIRVHCAAVGHQLVGDVLYGKESKIINRQALHAQSLGFTFEEETFSFLQPIPADFKALLAHLEKEKSSSLV